MRILLAEDNVLTRKYYATTLKARRFDVIEASNGREAIEILQINNGNFDIAIIDIIMPEIDGYAVADYINKNYPDISTMAISGSGTILNINGHFDFSIHKPLTATKLYSNILTTFKLANV